MRQIAIIRRAEEFSPNSVANDAAIFEALATELQASGFRVTEYNESDIAYTYRGEQTLIHMARHTETMTFLRKLEQKGCRVLNSTSSISNCDRVQMTNLLQNAGVPHPPTLILPTNRAIEPNDISFEKMWVKRADGYTQCPEDVCFVEDKGMLQSILTGFANRGISSVVINEHIEGNLVKFYGVSETSFFHWFYPVNENHSKFGQEAINGHNADWTFDHNNLAGICRKAALVLDLAIWGGDAIVSPDGKIQIIDFNDFPSFKPCRSEAAKAMVAAVSKLF